MGMAEELTFFETKLLYSFPSMYLDGPEAPLQSLQFQDP